MQSGNLGRGRPIFGRILGTIAGLLAGLSGAVVQADTRVDEKDPLWQRAAHYFATEIWVPGEVWIEEKVFNMDRALEETQRLLLGIVSHRNQMLRVGLISAEENGVDISTEVRPSLEGLRPLAEVVDASPFVTAAKQKVAFWRNGRQRRIDGVDCEAFAYRFSTPEGEIEGIAWLAQRSGLPVEITAEVISVPFKADGVTVTAHTETRRFAIDADGRCILIHMRSRSQISVWGFKGQVETEHRYRRHWRWQPSGHSGG